MEVVTPEFDNCIWWLRVAEVGIVDVEEHAGAFTTIDKAKWYRFSGGVPRRVIVIEQ